MNFKNFRNDKIVIEAQENLSNNYAVISGDLEIIKNSLSEYTLYKIDNIPTYKSKTLIENKNSYLVINTGDSKVFKEKIIEVAVEHNQNNIRLFEGGSNYLISTNLDIHAYPGYGKIGVQIELNFDLFNNRALTPLPEFTESVEEGLNIIFPTENTKF